MSAKIISGAVIAKDINSVIMPVSGGLGPMKIRMLMKNSVRAAKMAAEILMEGFYEGGRFIDRLFFYKSINFKITTYIFGTLV